MTTLTREDIIEQTIEYTVQSTMKERLYANKRCQELALKIANELPTIIRLIRMGRSVEASTKLIVLNEVLRSAQGEKKKDE